MLQNKVPDNLSGQYIGDYTNISSGKSSVLCVNIDHIRASNHEACATIFSGDKIYTSRFSFDWTVNPSKISVAISDVREFVRQNNGDFKKTEPTLQQYKEAELRIEWNYGLRLTWSSNGETMQSDGLIQTVNEPSKLDATILSWEKYKRTVENLDQRRYIFRGQSVKNRLRSSFHRTNRFNIARYYKNNLPELQHFLSSVYKEYFSLTESSNLISMLSLAQHYGYPTPILDWTASPYIAAHFAFFSASKNAAEKSNNTSNDHIRIYQFNLEAYQKDFPQFLDVNDNSLHVSFVVTPPLNNPRSIPQQSISCVSTIGDIESYMDYVGKANSKRYLSAYDIPVSETHKVINDLELMGITTASLFPGLDGVCAYLKHKHFE